MTGFIGAAILLFTVCAFILLLAAYRAPRSPAWLHAGQVPDFVIIGLMAALLVGLTYVIHFAVNGGDLAWLQWCAIALVPAVGVGLWRKLGMGEQLEAAEARAAIHDGAPVRPQPPSAPPKGPAAPRLDRAA